MQLGLNLSLSEAEELLISLHFRNCQRRHEGANNELGTRLGAAFETAFKAAPGWWQRISSDRVAVTIKPR